MPMSHLCTISSTAPKRAVPRQTVGLFGCSRISALAENSLAGSGANQYPHATPGRSELPTETLKPISEFRRWPRGVPALAEALGLQDLQLYGTGTMISESGTKSRVGSRRSQGTLLRTTFMVLSRARCLSAEEIRPTALEAFRPELPGDMGVVLHQDYALADDILLESHRTTHEVLVVLFRAEALHNGLGEPAPVVAHGFAAPGKTGPRTSGSATGILPAP